ncbi:MAG: hypothetical protein HFF17_03275 [Oscillospiraceae bacterium]|nr:hypothetical protein [Oscillospiraceae bacterium]
MDGRGGGAAALTEPAAGARGYCLWCGGEVYAGEPAFAGSGGLVHGGCMADCLAETPGVAFLAAVCGFEEVIV